MPEQFKFPFKEKEDEEKIIGRTLKGEIPTIEDDEALTIAEGGKPTSQEKNRQAAKKVFDTVLGRREEKDKGEK